MKLLVVGEGSIGKRRKMILEEMGHDVKSIDSKNGKLLSVNEAKNYDAIFICLPPVACVENALYCSYANTPFFLEKPGATDYRNFLTLVGATDKTDLVNMIACNIRFTPEYRAIQEALPNIGKPLFTYAEFGYYLPFWREAPYTTYYSCYRMAGGGILMDSIHELDYMFSLFGYPDKSKLSIVTYENSKELKDLDSDDTANVYIVYGAGLNMAIHMDYLQRAYKRVFFAIGTKGRIDQTFNVQGSNTMYRDEMTHFLDCVKHGVDTCKPVWQHARLLEFIDKAKHDEQAID